MNIVDAAAVKVQNAGVPAFNRKYLGKVHHQTQREAKDVAKLMHKKMHKPFAAYKCPYCDGWHTGTIRSREAAERRGKV